MAECALAGFFGGFVGGIMVFVIPLLLDAWEQNHREVEADD